MNQQALSLQGFSHFNLGSFKTADFERRLDNQSETASAFSSLNIHEICTATETSTCNLLSVVHFSRLNTTRVNFFCGDIFT